MSYYFKFDKGDQNVPPAQTYDPLLLDYHYRLEWDIVEPDEFATTHQVRIFDQGGTDGFKKFSEYLSDIMEAKKAGMVENVSYSYREVRIDPDWCAGAPVTRKEEL